MRPVRAVTMRALLRVPWEGSGALQHASHPPHTRAPSLSRPRPRLQAALKAHSGEPFDAVLYPLQKGGLL